jgi:hypothetical protein
MRIFFASLAAAAALSGCTSDGPGGDDDPGPGPTAVFLSPTEHLARASLALRGLRPSIADLQAVADDPAQVPVIVDRYLDSPEFGETIKELHNERLFLRVEQNVLALPSVDALAGKTFQEVNSAVFEEPLRLIEDIVMSGRPYTEIVTADYTMANGTTATVWGLDHTGAPDVWERTTWNDGRPAAGILSSAALYHRHRSTGFNFNRGRANMISSALLCHDYLDSEIMIDTNVDLSDPAVVADAVVENASCAGCHQSLDPLASYLFAFRRSIQVGRVETYPIPTYYPGQVDQWENTNERPPMYFGATADGLNGLGQAIADDPRFARCAAIHLASYLSETPEGDLSGAWVARLQAGFVEGGFDAKQLARDVVLSDEFRVAYDTDATRAEATIGYLKARPEQLARMVKDLTGFAWAFESTQNVRGAPYGHADLLNSDLVGFRVLGGGIDSYYVTRPVFTMNATSSLVANELGQAAADFVVEHDATAPADQRTLFTAAAVDATDEASVRAQLAALHGRIFSELVTADDPALDAGYELFADALALSGSAKRAWKVTLTAMLSDFRALFY